MKTKTKMGDLKASATIGTTLTAAELDTVMGGLMPCDTNTGYLSTATSNKDSDPICADN